MAAPIIDTGRALQVEEGGRNYAHITTNATTVIKSGPGNLHILGVNTKGTAWVLTVYDNTAGSGTVIAVIDAASAVNSLFYDLAFNTGLTIVSSGTTPGDITVVYR